MLKPNAPAPTMESYDRHREEVGRRIDFSSSVMFTNGARRSRRARDGDNLGRFFLLKLQKSTSVKEMKLKVYAPSILLNTKTTVLTEGLDRIVGEDTGLLSDRLLQG